MKLGAKKTKAENATSNNPAFNNSFNSSYIRDDVRRDINFTSDNTRPDHDFSISWSYVSETNVEEEEKVTIERKYEFITEWSIPLDNEEESSLSRYSSDFIVDWR